MDTLDTLTKLAREIGIAFLPLQKALQSNSEFEKFMKNLGWNFPSPTPVFTNMKAALDLLKNLVNNANFDLNTALQVRAQIQNLITAIKAIKTAADASFPNTVDISNFKNHFPQQLLQYLIVEYLQSTKSKIAAALQIAGIIRLTDMPEIGTIPEYIKKEINLSDLGRFLNDPTSVFSDAFDWGSNSFDQEAIRKAVFALATALDFKVLQENLAAEIEALIPDLPPLPLSYKIILYEDLAAIPPIEVGIGFQTMPAVNGLPPGFCINPFAPKSMEQVFNISSDKKIILDLGYDVSKGVAVYVRPNNLSIKTNIIGSPFGEEPPNAFKLRLGFEYKKADGTPTIIFGKADETRLEFLSYSALLGMKVLSSEKHELFLDNKLKGGKLVIKGGENDGFLNTILPKEGLSGTFDLDVGWSSTKGVYFDGSGGFDISLPLHIEFPSLEINGMNIGLKPDLIGLPFDLGTNFTANLGPLAATIENIGFKSSLTFPLDNSGNLGFANYEMSFKPPNGVGLSIDTGVIKGGGFVQYYPERGEYSGALELTFSEVISLKAIGLINTKMPDGSPGFSLVIIITAEFGVGIQLGFGFTLLAVGGLVGVNRTMNVDALALGVRTGAVNGVMFPTNIVENAPRIIKDLKNFFPINSGTFLIGPMAKIGWGTPTLISISLGIIIQIPGNVVILGILKIALPVEEAPLIVLQVNFIGVIEFDKQRIWFFAVMYESRVLFITLEGEMGFLVAFGNDANFVATIGGFHPAFNPPALPFPNPVRISLNILNTSHAKIRILGYFAITSNTAQFGARAELYFGFSALKVEGHIGFDALFQFSPFYVIIQVSASLSVKVFGTGVFSVRVKMRLEGPTPWIAHGTGSISALFFDIDVDIDVTWGEKKNTSLPPIFVMPIVSREYEKQENWKALVPANNRLNVTLRKIEPTIELVLHPLGSLQLSQRAIPLKLILNKVGSQKPADANSFDISPIDDSLTIINRIKEKFAIAQFQDLKDAEKLSAPSYQDIDGGIELSVSGSQLKIGKSVKRNIRYELVTIDSNYKRHATKFFLFIKALFGNFLRGNAVAKSIVSHQTLSNLQPFAEKIQTKEQGFAVAITKDNSMFEKAVQFTSQAQAIEYMKVQIKKDPLLAQTLHVLPLTEINPAA